MSKIKSIGPVNILISLMAVSLLAPVKLLTPLFIGLLLIFLIIRYLFFVPVIHMKKLTQISWIFLCYFMLIFGSLSYSENLNHGIEVVLAHSSFLVIPLIPVFVSSKEIDIEFISKNYIYVLCLIFFVLLLTAVYKNFEEGYSLTYLKNAFFGTEPAIGKYKYFNYWYFAYEKFVGPIKIQPIYIGLFANIGISLLYYLKTQKKTKHYYLQLIVLGLLVILSGSRWQSLILIVNYIIFTVFFQKSKFLTKTVVLAVFGLTISVIILSNPVTKTRFKEAFNAKEAFYEDQFGSTSIRLKKWSSAVKCISDSPFIGYGVGDGKEVLLNQFLKDKFYLGFYNEYNSHNQYLDTMLSIGLCGLLTLVLMFYYSYKQSRDKLYLLMTTNTFLISFLTESMLYRQWGIVSFSFFMVVFSTFDFNKR